MTEIKSVSTVVKNKVKNLPYLYDLCRFISNPGLRFYPPKRNKLLNSLLKSKDARVLNIGSGSTGISQSIINTDISIFKDVDVVSDAHILPFRTGVFDGLLLEAILEHVSDPYQVIKEASRVLKKGGILFVEFPFMYEFHDAPVDYYRFTLNGMEKMLRDFKKIDSGIAMGPTGTFNAIVRNYFALVFSFGTPVLYEFLNILFGIILFPLKFLDFFLIRLHYAENISSGFYFIGENNV